MLPTTASSRKRLSSSRALVCDILHYDRQMPSFVHSKLMDLARLAELRGRSPRRLSWSILFIKAFGLLSVECPVLRQTFLPWPWPHVYQHPHSIGTLAMSREHQCHERLFWLRLRRPETYSLVELQQSLDRHQQEPVETLFTRQLLLSRLPAPLRRLGWWLTMNLSGAKRASRLGTFALTTLAAEGVEIERPPSLHTATLTYGPLDADGRCRVALAYDHRLLDGLLIARCLNRLEALLNTSIADELFTLFSSPDRTAAPISPRRRAS